MKPFYNLTTLPGEFVSHFLGKASTAYLGKAAGSEKLYVNIDRIQPGAKSAKYHSHSKQEEFFFILKGSGTLRMNGEEHAVGQGDFVAKPAGRGHAHQFINTGVELLEILDVGTVDQGDVVHYPDEQTYYLKDEQLVFHEKDRLNGWDSEPNSR